MRWDRFWSLFAFIVMIFPFFHGMTRHFYRTYLTHPNTELATVALWLMFDGVMFMTMSDHSAETKSQRPNLPCWQSS
jgi:hypothetical protein